MFAVERGGRTICIDIFQLPMPPHVAPFLHVDVVAGAAKNDHAFYGRPAVQRVIHVFL